MENEQTLEEALLVEDLHTGEIIVERANGEKWLLDAKKGWCPWGYEFEGKRVMLQIRAGHLNPGQRSRRAVRILDGEADRVTVSPPERG